MHSPKTNGWNLTMLLGKGETSTKPIVEVPAAKFSWM